MGFFMGLLGGIVAGAAGAVWYTQQTGRDLRDELRQVRSEIGSRDFEGLASHLEDRFKELQASMDRMRDEASQRAGETTDDRTSSGLAATEAAAEEARARADEATQT